MAGLGLIAGCSAPPPPPAPSVPPAAPQASAEASAARPAAAPTLPSTPAPAPGPATSVAKLPPPGPVRNWNELRHQAALRIVAANPTGTYTGPVPEPLLAIPVLEVHLNADGTVQKIEYLRRPRQAHDTLELAAAAVRRAEPFGDVSRLPRPWRFTETFLFRDDRRFKPRTLD